MRIALIGCGEHSEEVHGTSLQHHASERPGEIQLVAACDINPARADFFCKKFGFKKPYTDYRQLLELEKPDAVVLVIPPALIPTIGVEILERKIPCVIEKPVGLTIEDTRLVAKVAAQTGTIHMVSVNRRFSPPLNKALAWAKAIGPIRALRGSMLRFNRTEPTFAWGTGLHLVDALCYLAGGGQNITNFQVNSDNGTADRKLTPWYTASFRFTSNGHPAIGSLEILTTTGMPEETYELMGENYRARLVSQYSGQATLQCWHNRKLVIDEATDPTGEMFVLRGEYLETAEFLNALRERRMPHPTVQEVLPSAELCHRLQIGR